MRILALKCTRAAISGVLTAMFCSGVASAQRAAPPARSDETGTLAGRVVDFTTGEPVAGALVQAGGPDSVATYSASDGSFVFSRVLVGEYDLVVLHSGYLTDFGTLNGRQLRPPSHVAKDQPADVTIRLIRGAVIGGQVIDTNGDPVPGALVAVGRVRFTGGRRRLVQSSNGPSQVTTDDEGRFRIGGLKAGRYFAWVSVESQPIFGRFQDPAAATFPIRSFAPGVAELSAASSIELGPGERQLDVTIVQLRGRAFTISGSIVSDGTTQPLFVTLIADNSEMEYSGGSLPGGAYDPQRGTFSFPSVTEGRYRVVVMGREVQPIASAEVDLAGSDVSGLVLRTSVATLHGRFVLEDGQMVPARLPGDETNPGFTCSIQPEAQMAGRECKGKPDGSFEISGLGSGRYRFWPSVPPEFSAQRVLLGATDVTDTPLDLRSDGRDDALTVVVTKRKTGLRGVVTDSLGRPQGGVVVAVFSTTPARWSLEWSRYVMSIATQRDGSFEWRGLPAGEYYVNVASGNPEWPLDEGPELDPELLGHLRSGAAVVNLVEDETRTVSLTIRQ
jgi:hypothetical protein